MLSQLKIKNFAIIDDLTIEFNDKMTVLTGETGSGKSIIIDAINLLIGERASSEMIRYDQEKAIVEGLFFFDNPKLKELLTDFGIECEDNTLIIIREITKNGRNICRLNGNLITVNQLKEIGNYLVDIHVQHDTQRLINTSNYLYLIDSFGDDEIKNEIQKYQTSLNYYMETLREYQELIKENTANQEKLDFYLFQQNEFRQANISIEEYNNLLEMRNQYVNYDKIFENLNLAHQLLVNNQILENIYECSNFLSKLNSVNTKYNELSEAMLTTYYQLEDIANILTNEIDSLDYNPQELDKIESRLNVYSTLKRKYRLEIEELIDYEKELSKKMEKIENFDFLINELKEKLMHLYKETLFLGLNIRRRRQEIAKEIESMLVVHLKDLKLMNTTFNIVFNELDINEEDYLNAKIFHQDGLDIIDFYVSFNLGEPVKPLGKVASGGELSRFMLGLKTILSLKQNLSTIIFDEIDTGVSGTTANAIAQKIKSISENTQVLCVTHLPQVAAISKHHFYISKIEENNRTYTMVKSLNQEERIMEIAKMIAGENINEVVINNAKNLMNIE